MIQPTSIPGKGDILKQADEALDHKIKKRTAALRESETRYRSIIDASPVSIMAIRDGCFLSVNPAGCRMLGYSGPDELLGMQAMKVVAPESQAHITERIKRLERGKNNPLDEAVLVKKDGINITVESSSVSVLIDGATTAMVFAQDITQRKNTESQLRDSEARLNAFMDHYPASIYIKDQNLRHVYANKHLMDSFRITPKSFIGTTSHDLFPADVANGMENHDRKVLSEKSIKYREIERIGQDGKREYYGDLKFLILLASGESLVGGISTDITERKRAEKKIEELRRFERLLADISTSFIDLPIEKIDQYINDALERIGRLLGFDRCSLGNVTPDHKAMIVTHVWNRGSVSGVQQSYALKQYPWLLSPFITGNALLWNKSMGLPDGSEADIRLFEESGMQSFAGIPLTVAGELKSCLGFSSVSDQKQWEPELYNRLEHLSHIFGNVLSRKQTDEDLKMMQYSIDHSSNRIAWIAPDGRFLYANEAACKEMHYTREQVLSIGVHDVHLGFPQEKWVEHYKHLKEVGSMRMKVQQIDSRGEMHHVDMSNTYNNFGGTEFVCSFTRDVTDLRRAERNLKEQLGFERLIADLSSELSQVDRDRLEQVIDSTLESLGRFLELDRSFLGQFTEDGSRLVINHTWADERFEKKSQIFQINIVSEIPWVAQQMLEGQVILAGPGLIGLPDEAQTLRNQLEQDGISSGVVVPMQVEGRTIGLLGLDTIDQPREYPAPIVDRMKIVANMIGTAINRIRTDAELFEQLAFEDLISRLSSTFIHIKASKIDATIERGLGLVANYLDIQRGNLYQFSRDNIELRLTHAFAAEGVEPIPKKIYSHQLPWFANRLLSGKTYCCSSLAELPQDAEEERAYLKKAGIKSAAVLPLMAAGVLHGGITLSALNAERSWPDKLVHQLNILTEVFSNALLRKRAHDFIQRRLDVESMLTNLATGFINLADEDAESYLEDALQKICDQFNADRASILQFNSDMSELQRTHMWGRDGINPDPHGLAIRVTEKFPGIYERLKRAETIIIPDTAVMQDTDPNVAAYCQANDIRAFIMLPLIIGENNMGAVVFSWIFSTMDFSDDRVKQLQLFSTIVANALARQRTSRILEESQQQTRRLAGRMLTIQENERKRLARELHDDLSQRLAVLAMSTSQTRSTLKPLSTEAADVIQSMHEQLVKISEDVHAISRQLHPSILEDLGLVDAVRNEINAFRRREGIDIGYLPSAIPENLPKDIALCYFRIIQEGLRNIAKHAQADAASIVLFTENDSIHMEIVDQGCGFDQGINREQLGLGLISMNERVRMIDGKLKITTSPGKGTRIQVSAPIPAEAKTR